MPEEKNKESKDLPEIKLLVEEGGSSCKLSIRSYSSDDCLEKIQKLIEMTRMRPKSDPEKIEYIG